MALADHFRELRARLIRSALVLVIPFCVAIFFYRQLLDVVQHPYNEARAALAHRDPPIRTEPVVNDATGGILLQFKLCGVVSLIAAAPYWLYQIWAFVAARAARQGEASTPGCSRPWPGPLFLGGVALGYYVLPKGLTVLISFVPQGVTNLVDFGRLLLLRDADAADLRHRHGDPAVRGAAELRRRHQRAGAGEEPAVDHHRHDGVRGGGDARRPTRSRC